MVLLLLFVVNYSSVYLNAPGLGGSDNNALFQAGAMCKVKPPVGDRSYYLWWEMIGTDLDEYIQQITSIACSPGDTIEVHVSYHIDDPYNTYFYVNNATTQQGTLFRKTFSYFTASGDVRSSAEWVFERPSYGSDHTYYYLANWSPTQIHVWNNFYTPTNGGNTTRLADGPDVFNMTIENTSHVNLAHTSLLNPGGSDTSSFLGYWDAYK